MNKAMLLLIFILTLGLAACNSGSPAVSGETKAEQPAASFCSSVSQIPVSECEALVAFYNSTGGPKWALKRGWLETQQPCDWAGVDCIDGHVSAIMLNYNDLRGPLPP